MGFGCAHRSFRLFAAVGLLTLAVGSPAWSACPGVTTAVASTNNCPWIDVSWEAVPEATGYDITRVGGPEGSVTLATNWPSTSFIDTDNTPGYEYFYRLRARKTPSLDCPTGLGPLSEFSNGGLRPSPPAAPAVMLDSTECAVVFNLTASSTTNLIRVYRSELNDFDTAAEVDALIPGVGGAAIFTDSAPPVTPPGAQYYWFRSFRGCAPGPIGPSFPVVLTSWLPVGAPVPTAGGGLSCGSAIITWPAVSGAVSYQVVFTNIIGEVVTVDTESTGYVDATAPAVGRTYTVRAVSLCGDSPFSAPVFVAPGPIGSAAIVGQPAGTVVDVGETISFSATIAPGVIAPAFSWQRDGVNIVPGPRYSGLSTTTLTISSIRPDDVGRYRLRVNAFCGTGFSSEAILAVRPTCPGDADLSGEVNADDIFAFLDDWFAQNGVPCP